MQTNAALLPNKTNLNSLDDSSVTNLTTSGEIDIGGQRYVTADTLAAMLGITGRTLCRWDAARIGPPKIKIGKLILFNLAKLPAWLATRETEPLRTAGRRR
jgi:hypothetical protein